MGQCATVETLPQPLAGEAEFHLADGHQHGRKPWRGAERKPPPRLRQAQNARDFDISVRSLQRATRVRRYAPDLVARIEAGKLKVGAAERIVRECQEVAVRAW